MIALVGLALLASTDLPTVAVLPLTKGAGSEAYDGLGKALAGMITTDLSTVEALQLVERERLSSLLEEIKLGKGGFIAKNTAQKLGKGIGAQFLVTGSYSVIQKQFLMDARVVSVQTGKVAKAASAAGTVDDFVAVEKELIEGLLDGLSVKLTSSARRKLIVQAPTENFKAFKAYSKGLDRRDRGKANEAKRAFERALAIDPKFEQARSALEGMANLVASEKEREASATQAITSAAHRKILAAFPDVREDPEALSGTDAANVGVVLRWIALDNEGRDCQRFKEMMHFLKRKRFRLPDVDRGFTSQASSQADNFGYQPIPDDVQGPDYRDDRIRSRAKFFTNIYAFVVGRYGPPTGWRQSDGVLGSMMRCIPPQKQLREIDRMKRMAKKARVINASERDDSYSIGEALDLTWCAIQAKHFGATAELEQRTKALLQGRDPGDRVRKRILQEIEQITGQAKRWSESQGRRLGQTSDTLRKVMHGVATGNAKVVRRSGATCKYLVKMVRGQAKSWVAREKKLKPEDGGRGPLVDQAGTIFGPLSDMGCLVGVRPRFKGPKEVFRYGRGMSDRVLPAADKNETCLSLLGSLEAMPWDQYDDMLKSMPQHVGGAVYGVLNFRYLLLSNGCIKD